MKTDLIIVGGGVAGCSAAITARQRGLETLVLYSGDGALESAHLVNNYPGLPDVSGKELLNRLREHAAQMGAKFEHGLVRQVMPFGESFMVLCGTEVHESRAVILALGAARAKALPNEEALLGQGVSYCATCDGMFYKDKQILVIGADEEAVEEANYLSTLGKVRYLVEKTHDLGALSPEISLLAGKVLSLDQKDGLIVVHTDKGDYEADGLFILRPTVAMTQLMPELTMENGKLYRTAKLETSVPGVFAAGDMLGAPLQAAKAAGDGNIAALSAASWLLLQKQGGKNA